MDPVRNPFAPGAGSQPPELAGRDDIISQAEIALQRAILGRHGRSQILLGLRGTGKTVLLNSILRSAEKHGHIVSFVEAPEEQRIGALLYPRIHQALRQLSAIESARAAGHSALRALRSFVGRFKIEIGDVSISVDPEPGVADSGNLELDLTDLFIRIGETAKAAGRGWTLLIDELQYVAEQELAALIVAIHHVNQRNLPVLMFAAGLPQIAALAGNAKSYAERLFQYVPVGPLPMSAAYIAIREPITGEGEMVLEEALAEIFHKTKGYPYFLQEWGYQAWNTADASPINAQHVETATTGALRRLDEGFFRVRLDRLTPKEREYVIAMAKLGAGPYRSSDVASALSEPIQNLGPRRAQIIRKGMIYSPAHGDIAFTVPMFDEFLRRRYPQQFEGE
jgi:AAA ATPase domain